MSAATTNPKELEALELFKEKLGQEYLQNELDSYQRLDANLLRWLQARELDVEKAVKMLKDSMEWRRDNQVEDILSWKRPDFFSSYNFMAPGFDKDECLISIIPFGKWDLRGAVEAGHRNDLIKYSNQILELGVKFWREHSNEKRTLNQFIAIFDWDGFSLHQILSRDTVETLMECLQIFEAHYPENLKEVFVINAPAVFELVFTLLKPFVTAHTLSKLRVFGTNSAQWREAILKNIDPAELPSSYGGSNTACKNYDFNDGIERLPKARDLPLESFKTVIISAGDKLVLDYNITVPGTTLTWNFKSDYYDLGFQFLKDDEELFSSARADSHLHLQRGVYTCKTTGLHKLCFDNSFSTFRSKTVHYSIHQSGQENSSLLTTGDPDQDQDLYDGVEEAVELIG